MMSDIDLLGGMAANPAGADLLSGTSLAVKERLLRAIQERTDKMMYEQGDVGEGATPIDASDLGGDYDDTTQS